MPRGRKDQFLISNVQKKENLSSKSGPTLRCTSEKLKSIRVFEKFKKVCLGKIKMDLLGHLLKKEFFNILNMMERLETFLLR